jgi:cytochrome b
MLFALLFRLAWGFVGSSTARFSQFVRGPRAMLRYLRGGARWERAGHNPIGALSVMILLLLLAAQVAFGLVLNDDDGLVSGPLAGLVSIDSSELANELHKDNFDLLLPIIGIHVAAIFFYWAACRMSLTRPMITGKAELDPSVEPMRPAPAGRAWISAAAALGLTAWVVAGVPPFGP